MVTARMTATDSAVRLAFLVGERCFAVHATEAEPVHHGLIFGQIRAGCSLLGIPVEGVSPEEFPEVNLPA